MIVLLFLWVMVLALACTMLYLAHLYMHDLEDLEKGPHWRYTPEPQNVRVLNDQDTL